MAEDHGTFEVEVGRSTDPLKILPPGSSGVYYNDGRFHSHATIEVYPGGDPAVVALRDEIQRVRQYAEARTIATVEDVALATDDLRMVATLKKSLDAKKREYTDPIRTHLETIANVFKGLLEPLQVADVIVRGKITVYRDAEDKRAREIEEINRMRQEAARREAALNDGEISEPTIFITPPVDLPARVHGEAATLGVTTNWTWELEDFAKVPDEYKLIDASKLGRVVRAGCRSIPGVRIFPKDSLRVTGR